MHYIIENNGGSRDVWIGKVKYFIQRDERLKTKNHRLAHAARELPFFNIVKVKEK